jgi:hypothetical protein
MLEFYFFECGCMVYGVAPIVKEVRPCKVHKTLEIRGFWVLRLVGKADCGECGGKGTKTLIIDRERGVFSKCQNCGFCEWEWTYGDSLD